MISPTSETYEKIDKTVDYTKKLKLKKDIVNPYLVSKGEREVISTTDIHSLTKRANVELSGLFELYDEMPEEIREIVDDKKLLKKAQTEIKYEGYIKRQAKEVEYFLNNENKLIPESFDYNKLNSISNEAREKLNMIRPRSLGQASRISGVSAADVSVISLYLK